MSASPLSNVVFRLSTSELTGEINLKPEAWRILSQVDGARTLSEIAQRIGMDMATAQRVAESLLQARILEVAAGTLAPVRATVDATFFNQLSIELARAVGPLAPVILEDAVAALGEKQESFPRERLADLIERVSEEIRDPARRLRFQQVMLEAIRKL
ncbi:MAG: hypothetical protein N2559_04880 [Anaerolineae bacterium]|nr:hypothetical protein [Anaerolineae bacterium]